MNHLDLIADDGVWSDPNRPLLGLTPGQPVLVLTADGALRRGRRLWTPGKTIGMVVKAHRLHERCWHVRFSSGITPLLFEDELDIIALEAA